MDRIIFGNTGTFSGTPEHGPSSSGYDYFNRENSSGIFISKPGKNVFSCNSADLLLSTDIASNGFVMAVASGNLQISPGTLNPHTGVVTENEVVVSTGVPAPHYPHVKNPVMVNWFIICGLGRTYGSNIYDCMGGNGLNSWDGSGKDDDGLPDGFNSLYTGSLLTPGELRGANTFDISGSEQLGISLYDTGSARRHFWQYPDVGVNNYHLSNTVVTNDPSASFWSWFEDPIEHGPAYTSQNHWGQGSISQYDTSDAKMGKFFQYDPSSALAPIDYRNLSKGLKISGDFIYAQTYIDTTVPNNPTVDIKFVNGHTKITYQIAYMVYREKGAL